MEKQNWKETRIIQHFFLPFTLSAWHFQEWNQQKEGRERKREMENKKILKKDKEE
jgi:hypothetical protein